MFCDSVNAVVSRFREVKRHEEAFVKFLPHRTQGEELSATEGSHIYFKAFRRPFHKAADKFYSRHVKMALLTHHNLHFISSVGDFLKYYFLTFLNTKILLRHRIKCPKWNLTCSMSLNEQ